MKRLFYIVFFGDIGLFGCINIFIDYSEIIVEWMGKFEKKFSKGLIFILYVMVIGGLEII